MQQGWGGGGEPKCGTGVFGGGGHILRIFGTGIMVKSTVHKVSSCKI